MRHDKHDKVSESAAPIRLLLTLVCVGLMLASDGCKKKKTPAGTTIAQPNTAEYADALGPMVSAPKLDFLRWGGLGEYQQPLNVFYNTREMQLAWSKDGRPTAQATALMEAFTHADDKGLRSEDYDSGRWAQRVQALSGKDHAAVAQFDVAMTVNAMRYLNDVHRGRVSPGHFSFEVDRKSKALDLPQFLNDQVLEASDIPDVVKKLEPDSELYRETLAALHTYQGLAKLQAEPLPMPAGQLTVNSHYRAVDALEQRLALEGDGEFAACSAQPDGGAGEAKCGRGTLSADDMAAVKAYQLRHGIAADGKLGPATVKSLNVPMSARVTQIEDALERWRWLPDPYVNPRLLVNLPEFVLRGFSPEHEQEFAMRVVDGKRKDNHATPVFTHMMKYMIFRPYWNVPVSIIKKELVAHVEANKGYLEAKNYEVLGKSGKPITEYTASSLEHGGYLVREKPGPTNSLGLVKFMFPNQYDIYLHSTPEKALFERTVRDYSHGCVRVQHPDELAVWVLRGQNAKDGGEWDVDKVNEAMNDEDGNNKQVNLKTELPIDIYYLTAFPQGEGKMGFFDDMYGYDADLEQTIQHGPPYPTAPLPPKQSTEPGDTV